MLFKKVNNETIYMNTENSKRNDSNKFRHHFTNKLNLKSLKKYSIRQFKYLLYMGKH